MTKSESLFAAAKKIIPGGVNSPVRAFQSVGGTPLFFKKAKGAMLIDEDNKEYIDYVGSWGPMILGHQNADILHAVEHALQQAMSFGAPSQAEITLAQHICHAIDSIEQVRMMNSGTEATMTAIRLARGYTGRNIILKFEGCYHGHHDALLVKAGSGALTFGQPSSAGIPEALTQYTLNLEFNNLSNVQKAFSTYGNDIAAVIVEPVAGNMGCILPQNGFLEGIRELCTKHGTLLIFDEVITGFRLGLSGAQGIYHITPDLTTLGKIIGGGMPVGALGGKRDIMALLAPQGPVYQAGTLSGNPLAMQAGIATLLKLQQPNFYEELQQKTDLLVNGLQEISHKNHIPTTINSACGLFSIFFTNHKINCYHDVMSCDIQRFNKFYHTMLQAGIYFGPSAYECAFISYSHDVHCIQKTLQAADQVFANLA